MIDVFVDELDLRGLEFVSIARVNDNLAVDSECGREWH